MPCNEHGSERPDECPKVRGIPRKSRASSSSGRHDCKGATHDVTERQAHDDQPVQVRSGETPRSPVVKPPASAEMPGRSGVEQLGGPQHEVKLAASLCGLRKQGKGRAELMGFGRRPRKHLRSWSGCRRTPRRMERGTSSRPSWELERPSSALVLRGCGVRLSITGEPGK